MFGVKVAHPCSAVRVVAAVLLRGRDDKVCMLTRSCGKVVVNAVQRVPMSFRARVGKSFFLNCNLMIGEGTKEQYTLETASIELEKMEGYRFLCGLNEREGRFLRHHHDDVLAPTGPESPARAGCSDAEKLGRAPDSESELEIVRAHHYDTPPPGVFDASGKVSFEKRESEKREIYRYLSAARTEVTPEFLDVRKPLAPFLLPSNPSPKSGELSLPHLAVAN